MKKCVVSFADSAGTYRAKQKRLEQSLKDNTDADILMFTDYREIDCEPHQAIPYKFKPMSISKAMDMGYELIIWCDSPIMATKDISPMFDHIERNGYVFFDNIGHDMGRWTNDKCLDYFGITRMDAHYIRMIMACCMGFNIHNERAKAFLTDYIGTADTLYPGSWDNHRHDQSVASCLIYLLDMEILRGQDTFFAYKDHFGVVPISESVCLLSQ